MKLSAFSVLIWSIVLVVVGVSLIPMLNVQLSPSGNHESMSVTYAWPGASARIIEQEVTSRLEGVFSGIKGLKEISSVTSKGSGSINLVFKKNTDQDAVRFEVSSLIRRIYHELPEEVTYPLLAVGSDGSKIRSILTYTLNASASPYYIQQFAERNLVPRLATVKGVNDVNVYGATRYEYIISYDPEKLRLHKIPFTDLTSAVNNYFRQDLLGMKDFEQSNNQNNEISVKLTSYVGREPDWNSVPVTKSGNRIIHLGDVAHVQYREQLPDSYYRINGLNAVFLVISAPEGANSLKISKDVKKAVQKIQKDLPSGYSMMLSNDSTSFLSEELRTIAYRSVASLLILMVFVLIVSRQWPYLLLIAFSMVANLAIAIIFYYLLRIEIHLYSLAGISVSFGMIITNSIVMIDHYRYHRNKSVFLAILAATLTTIGSLCVIFFLKEQDRMNLIDFAWVMIINLSVSIAIALWFIPALIEKITLKNRISNFSIKKKKRVVRFSMTYAKVIRYSKKYRWVLVVLLVLGFGIPVHWLPDKIEKEGKLAGIYNSTLGGSWFQKKIKPAAGRLLGGSLRLFSEHLVKGSFYSEPQRTTLFINGSMPEGCTVHQLNEAMLKMENYVSRYKEVELFETSLYNYQQGNIRIQFKKEFENSAFPFQLKDALTSKAIGLGGVDWGIYGVGEGFSNALYNGFLGNRIILEGFNYDQLFRYATELITRLKKNQRVGKIEITGENYWGSSPALNEYYMSFNLQRMAVQGLTLKNYYDFLLPQLYRQPIRPVYTKEGMVPVFMVSENADDYNTWWIKNGPVSSEKSDSKLLSMGSITKQRIGNDIYRNNQQYRLTVGYDFIGPGELASRVKKRTIAETAALLPLGYKVRDENYNWWWNDEPGQYYLILLVLLIIYLICAILLESLLQPLAIMALIPVSFIGVFLTFYIFKFNFDQGGFASFILLSGVVVNSGLFIINDYNNLKTPKGQSLQTYIKAYNQKIIPVMLTILSTIIGLIPFVWGGQHEVFWFAFAAGTIGGLIFSIIALIVFQPVFLKIPGSAIINKPL